MATEEFRQVFEAYKVLTTTEPRFADANEASSPQSRTTNEPSFADAASFFNRAGKVFANFASEISEPVPGGPVRHNCAARAFDRIASDHRRRQVQLANDIEETTARLAQHAWQRGVEMEAWDQRKKEFWSECLYVALLYFFALLSVVAVLYKCELSIWLMFLLMVPLVCMTFPYQALVACEEGLQAVEMATMHEERCRNDLAQLRSDASHAAREEQEALRDASMCENGGLGFALGLKLCAYYGLEFLLKFLSEE